MKHLLSRAAAAAALATVISPLPAAAEVPLTLNAGVGRWILDSDRDLDDPMTPWVSVEYGFNRNWAAELLYAEDDTEADNGGPRVDISTWQLDVLYYRSQYAEEERTVRPYLAFGAGELSLDSALDDSDETILNWGAGLRFMLGGRVGARAEARMLYGLDDNENDWLMSFGLSYYFGDTGGRRASPEPEREPTPVTTRPQPVDSDGDGVLDDADQCPGTAADTRVDDRGCKIPVVRVASIKMTVNFPFDSDSIQQQYFDDIEELAEFLRRFEQIDIQLEGHTDDIGSASYNEKLSRERASAVADVLVNRYGIDRERLRPVGYGESRPVASNDTDAGRAKNRRVIADVEVEYEE